ncbi:T9SS type A sorting domain-containing protein, partial [Christiangramia forsetii]
DYSFTYTLAANGDCDGDTAVFTIEVFEQPDAGDNGDDKFCFGDLSKSSVNLIDVLEGSPDNGGSWIETSIVSSGLTIGNGINLDFTEVVSGVYTFKYTVNPIGENSNCEPDFAIVTITIDVVPLVPEIQIKQADCFVDTGSITITSSMDGLTFLLVRIDGDALLVIENYENLEEGDYELTAENEAGCISDVREFSIEGPRDTPITPIVDKIDPDCETLQGTIIVTSRTIGLRFAILLTSEVPSEIASIPDSEFMTYTEGGFEGYAPGDYTVVAKSNDGCLSGLTAVSLIEPICEEFEGCTLGYWKNHTDRWGCYSTCTLYSAVFGIGEDHYVPEELQGKTLLQVLNLGGGGVYNMGRQSVAALLNICHGDVNYEILTEAELVLYVQDSFDNAGAAGSYLDELNNAGCTLGGSRATTAPSEGCDVPEDSKPGKGKPAKNNRISETGNFKASPVPFNERLTIQYDFEYTSSKIEIQVYDLTGRLLRTYKDKKVTKGDTKELDIDFALKANQVYIVRMITDREVISKNIISSTKK